MNTFTKGALTTLGMTVVAFVGMVGVVHAEAYLPDATSDETYFIQKTLRLSDRKITKISPIKLDADINATTSNIINRTWFYREKARASDTALQPLGEVVTIDLGSDGVIDSITVSRGKNGFSRVAQFQRIWSGDWIAYSTPGRVSRSLIVPAMFGTGSNNMRLNGQLIAALDALERRSVEGNKVTEFVMVAYAEEMGNITFVVSPVNNLTKTYTFINGELQ